MFDTNIFDVLGEDRSLTDLCRTLVEKETVKFYTSYVQTAELEKIGGSKEKEAKREKLLKLLDELHIEKLFPAGVLGSNTTKHGYDMARIGEFKWVLSASPFEELARPPNTAHPIGENGADLLTLGCARDDGMDYLVTQNTEDFEAGWKFLQEREGTKLKLIDAGQFTSLLQGGFPSNPPNAAE